MQKALKRQLGREKQAKNLQESIEAGLKAQYLDSVRRDNQYRQNLLDRDEQSKKRKRPENEGSSKLSQEKKARVEQRRAEKEQMGELDLAYERNFIALNDMDDIQSDLERPDGDLGVSETYLAINLLEVLFGNPDWKETP